MDAVHAACANELIDPLIKAGDIIWLASDGAAWLSEPGGRPIPFDLWSELHRGRIEGFVTWEDGGVLLRDGRPEALR